jgi:uncharacterized membrane protein
VSEGGHVIKLRLTTVVNQPLEVVFAYLSDFMNLPEYEPWVEKVEATSAGPVGVGSTWHHVRRQGRRRLEAPIEIVEWEPNRKLAIRSGAGAFNVFTTQDFEQNGDATRVTETLEMRVSGLLRLMEPLMWRQAWRQGEEIHQRFKEILERDAAS